MSKPKTVRQVLEYPSMGLDDPLGKEMIPDSITWLIDHAIATADILSCCGEHVNAEVLPETINQLAWGLELDLRNAKRILDVWQKERRDPRSPTSNTPKNGRKWENQEDGHE